MILQFHENLIIRRRCPMNKRSFASIIALVLLSYASNSFAIAVWFDPSPASIQAGDNFDLILRADLGISDLSEPVTQFKLDILFDPTLMMLNSITGGIAGRL
jgi:hypothetical protein